MPPTHGKRIYLISNAVGRELRFFYPDERRRKSNNNMANEIKLFQLLLNDSMNSYRLPKDDLDPCPTNF